MKNLKPLQQRGRKVVVIGAGIAGLAAAHALRKRGIEVEVVEREAVAGGFVRSAMKEERYLVELGPNTFLAGAEPIRCLARELSIEPLIVESGPLSRNRYIYRGGCLHRLPLGPLSFMRSGLLSFSGKMRLMAEPFIRSRSAGSETLAAFARRRIGREACAALIDPLASGVWGGDPLELEVASILPGVVQIERECRSLFRGMRKLSSGTRQRGLFSFRWGMGTITARLEEELKGRMRLGVAAEGVERRPDGRWRVKLSGWHAAIEADALLLATPAHAAAKLLLPLDPKIFPVLQAIPYAPIAVVHTAFRESDLPKKPDGFGVLIPRGEGIRMLGSIWSSALFPGRCPRGEVLLTNFLGGATDASLVDCPDEEIVGEVRFGLRTMMGIEAAPKFVSLRRWGQAIAQYTVGHQERLALIRGQLEGLPGLFLAGSYFAGVSVSDTIAHARTVVDKIVAHLK